MKLLMSITGSLIKISASIKQGTFRQLMQVREPFKVKWKAKKNEII